MAGAGAGEVKKMKIKCHCPNLTDEEFHALELQELHLAGRSFYEVRVPMLSHFPLAPEMRIDKALTEIERQGLTVVRPLRVLFADGMLIGKMMVEIENTGQVGNKVVTYGDTRLIGKAYAGPRYLVPKALKDFDLHLLKEDRLATDYYFWFLSCQGCEQAKRSRTIIYAKIK